MEQNYILRKNIDESFTYKPDPKLYTYYQICQFPIKNTYNVRKVILDEYGNFKSQTTGKIPKDRLKKFLKSCPKFKYGLYQTFLLDEVPMPSLGDISLIQSEILNEL